MDGGGASFSGVEERAIVPPLKWAGGKRWLIARYPKLFHHPFNRYIEPFVGSGAIFFALSPPRAVLTDVNGDLINFYTALTRDPKGVEEGLHEHASRHCPEYYYQIRSGVPESLVEQAARFLYLNRTCWNALYRVNRAGFFNVPIGSKTNVLLESDDFAGWSLRLKKANMVACDFLEPISTAAAGDFVFVDPPYKVADGIGFVKYNPSEFGWDDQVRLAVAVREAVARGARVLVSNLNHRSIRSLYRGFKITNVDRTGVIAGSSEARGTYREVIIKCW